jgi:hypothetical protein
LISESRYFHWNHLFQKAIIRFHWAQKKAYQISLICDFNSMVLLRQYMHRFFIKLGSSPRDIFYSPWNVTLYLVVPVRNLTESLSLICFLLSFFFNIKEGTQDSNQLIFLKLHNNNNKKHIKKQ